MQSDVDELGSITMSAVGRDRVELNADSIVRTAQTLHRRVESRFPGRGLTKQAALLVQLAEQGKIRSAEIARPLWWTRLLYVALAVAVVIGLLAIPFDLSSNEQRDFLEWVQIIEAGINDLVLLGAGIAFVITVETRVKRRRCRHELHQLRSLAHVIDMHQLTKDPQRVVGAQDADRRVPEAEMTPFELGRYLDYCSELLSISGKVAALYVQDFDDSVALEAVSEIESLTTGLSRKIWQKMSILIAAHPDAVGPAKLVPPSAVDSSSLPANKSSEQTKAE